MSRRRGRKHVKRMGDSGGYNQSTSETPLPVQDALGDGRGRVIMNYLKNRTITDPDEILSMYGRDLVEKYDLLKQEPTVITSALVATRTTRRVIIFDD